MALKKSSKRFKVATEGVNLKGFKLDVAGIQLTGFLENPTHLYNHDPNKIMGNWTDVKVIGKTLTAVPQFDENDPEAMINYQKVEDDLLKGSSVGIIPLMFDKKSETITSSILFEISTTPIPADQGAIVLYNTEGIQLNSDQANSLLLSLNPKDKPQPKIMKDSLKKLILTLCAAFGVQLSMADSDEQFEAALDKVKPEAEKAKKDLTAIEEKIKTDLSARVTKKVDNAVTVDKTIPEADRASFVTLGLSNEEMLDNMLAKLKPAGASAPGTPAPIGLNINQQLAALGAGKAAESDNNPANWTFDDFASKGKGLLEKLKVEDPQRFNLLLNAKNQSVRSSINIED